MAGIFFHDQPPSPLLDFLREIGARHGLAPFDQQPPAYSQQGNPGQQSTAEAPSQTAEAPANTEQHEQHASNAGREPSARRGGCRRAGPHGRGGPCGRGGPGRRGGPWAARCGPRWVRGSGAAFPDDSLDLSSLFETLQSHFPQLHEVLNGMGAPRHDDIDFVPKADVFDTPAQYLVHVSLPGAHKEDISVDYDTASSTLRLAGVVYRPGIDESLNESLVVRGRDRDVGVFEREIVLGTTREPAYVDVDHISASLTDGVLIVVLPKLSDSEKPQKTKVPVTQVEKEGNEEALPEDMEVESETEAGDGPATPPSPTARDEEDEERDYITVDVD